MLISRGNTWQDRRRFYHSDSIYTRLHCEEIGTVIYDMIDDLDDERCLQLEECVQMDIEDNDSKYIVCHEKMNENQGGQGPTVPHRDLRSPNTTNNGER